jgi:general secretion pathway protein C
MSTLQIRALSLLMFAVLCATVAYWTVTLVNQRNAPAPVVAAPPTPVTVADAASLFGGQLATAAQETEITLSGVLTLANGAAAAIVGVFNGPTRAVTVGQGIGSDATLAEVRARSIVIDRHGARSEIALPAPGAGPTIYMR